MSQKISYIIDFGVVKSIQIFTWIVFWSLTVYFFIFDPSNASISTSLLFLSRTNWLKYKKYVSTYCLKNIRLRTPDTTVKTFQGTLEYATEVAIFTLCPYRYGNFAPFKWKENRSKRVAIIYMHCELKDTTKDGLTFQSESQDKLTILY